MNCECAKASKQELRECLARYALDLYKANLIKHAYVREIHELKVKLVTIDRAKKSKRRKK